VSGAAALCCEAVARRPAQDGRRVTCKPATTPVLPGRPVNFQRSALTFGWRACFCATRTGDPVLSIIVFQCHEPEPLAAQPAALRESSVVVRFFPAPNRRRTIVNAALLPFDCWPVGRGRLDQQPSSPWRKRRVAWISQWRPPASMARLCCRLEHSGFSRGACYGGAGRRVSLAVFFVGIASASGGVSLGVLSSQWTYTFIADAVLLASSAATLHLSLWLPDINGTPCGHAIRVHNVIRAPDRAGRQLSASGGPFSTRSLGLPVACNGLAFISGWRSCVCR